MRPSVPDVHITDPQDAELSEYRALAGQAVLGLVFGLLSPLAMVDPMLWSIPVLAVVLSWWALRRINRSAPALAGRKMAIAGLMLSLLFLAAAPGDWLTYRWLVRDEARQFSALWFQYLAEDEPQKAFQLAMAPEMRRPLSGKLREYYRDEPRAREQLESYVKMAPVRTLLALGPRAQVRFYQTVGQGREKGEDQIEQLYAVTYEEDGERKSFFVGVQMARSRLADGGAGWRMLRADDGVRPEGW